MFLPSSSDKETKFVHLSQADDSERFDIGSDGRSEEEVDLERPLPSSLLPFACLSILVLTSSLSFAIGRSWNPTLLFDPEIITQYSPILEDTPLIYTPTQFNGSLLRENIFRQQASPAVDAAWITLGVDYRAVIVPPSLAAKSNLATDQVKISPRYGGGFPANVEGLHHLHCLNLLRQALFYNYPYYKQKGEGAFKNEPYIVQKHVSHCLDILRQQLMCTVDVGVLGQVWIHPEAPEAYVDFNTMHKCRNFDEVREWARKRQMPEKVPDDWLEPPLLTDRVYEEIP